MRLHANSSTPWSIAGAGRLGASTTSGLVPLPLRWFRTWDRVFDWDFPTFRWFIGGQTNLAYNCLDYHVQGDGVAIQR